MPKERLKMKQICIYMREKVPCSDNFFKKIYRNPQVTQWGV